MSSAGGAQDKLSERAPGRSPDYGLSTFARSVDAGSTAERGSRYFFFFDGISRWPRLKTSTFELPPASMPVVSPETADCPGGW